MSRAYILILTQVGKSDRVANESSRIDGVSSAEAVTGPYDVVVEAEGSDLWDIQRRVLPEIQQVDGITRTLTCPVGAL